MRDGNRTFNRFDVAALICLSLSFLFGYPGFAGAQNVIQPSAHGRIDWSNGVVEALAIGRPPAQYTNAAQARSIAKKRALESVRHHLIGVVREIHIDSITRITDLFDGGDKKSEGITRYVNDFHVADLSYQRDGTVSVTASIQLKDFFIDLVLPHSVRHIASITQTGAVNREEPEGYTGLVVDCTGFPLTSALVPCIVDEDGNEVYGPVYADREFARKGGLAGYDRDLESAKSHGRVGKRPMIVKGIRTVKGISSDIVISNADAAKIKSSASHLKFLQKCRVMIVLD